MGSSVLSAAHTSDTGTATFSGTSMACPHVSGAAALVLGADNSKSPQKVISDLLDDAALDTISDLKAGDTNALLFVGAGGAPPTPPTQAPPPTPAPNWTVLQLLPAGILRIPGVLWRLLVLLEHEAPMRAVVE